MRLAVPRVPRGRADRLRRRSARGRTDLLTSRYPLSFDDRGVRAGSGRDQDPCRGRPDGAASGRRRWPPEYRCAAGCAYFACRRNAISGRFSGGLSRVSRSRMAADAPGGRGTLPRPPSMPAGPANPASEPGIASPPRTAPARAARDPGDHPRLLSVISRRQPGYRVTIVLFARLAALGTSARAWHISDPSRARNARRTATVTGAED